MKKLSISVFIVILFTVSSCSTAPTITPTAGSWTIKGIHYTATTCTANQYGYMTASDGTTGAAQNLSGATFDNMLPSMSGTFYVTQLATSANQVVLTATIAGVAYFSLPGSTVAITVSSGKVNINGSGIRVYHQTDTTDLTLNITQQ
jgi:hypothetical protein